MAKVLIIERDVEPGGILQQCIHNGFGIHIFNEELTGPEYAQRFIKMAKEENVDILLDTIVISISRDKIIKAMSGNGIVNIAAKAIVLAMGCRERTRGSIAIAGDRPSGIFTAGTAQRYINIEGYMVGKKVIILGAGDIGMIMARRIVLEGGEVIAVIARGSYAKGLTRNVVQCLEHYNIPLLLNHNIINISGKERVERVTIAATDEKKEVIPGTEKEYECDTVLLSVGLIPENELSRIAGIEIDRKTSGPFVNESMETSIPGIFACGNVVHVHDVVDFVTEESIRAGTNAARFVKEEIKSESDYMSTVVSGGISYCVPQRIRYSAMLDKLDLFMRVDNVYPEARIIIKNQGKELARFKKTNLTPGEMIKQGVRKSFFENAKGDIEISLEVGGSK
jgi:NADPH-dependent 2,4-dienoyl-CoA reductase/sulfur reductase-like enzyme